MAVRPAQAQRSPSHEVDLLLARELLGPPTGRASALQDLDELHVCPSCRLPFVLPGQIREVVGVDKVRLDLECANCDWTATRVHHDSELETLDMALDRSFADLLWTLEVVWIANEESAIERFASALAADAILPEDF
jgi:hypothetical protein